MNKLLATAGAIAVLALTSTAAEAVTPATQATATAKIFKPLTIASTQNHLRHGRRRSDLLGRSEAGDLSSGRTGECRRDDHVTRI